MTPSFGFKVGQSRWKTEREATVPTYVTLYKLTDQGIRNIRQAPERLQAGIKAVEALGGKLISFYLTMGEYDYVVISEAPNDEAVAAGALAGGALGNVRSTTMRAFTQQEFVRIVKSLPSQ